MTAYRRFETRAGGDASACILTVDGGDSASDRSVKELGLSTEDAIYSDGRSLYPRKTLARRTQAGEYES